MTLVFSTERFSDHLTFDLACLCPLTMQSWAEHFLLGPLEKKGCCTDLKLELFSLFSGPAPFSPSGLQPTGNSWCSLHLENSSLVHM